MSEAGRAIRFEERAFVAGLRKETGQRRGIAVGGGASYLLSIDPGEASVPTVTIHSVSGQEKFVVLVNEKGQPFVDMEEAVEWAIHDHFEKYVWPKLVKARESTVFVKVKQFWVNGEAVLHWSGRYDRTYSPPDERGE
jgi:hypothetical protein